MNMLTEAIERLFRERVTPQVVRQIEEDGSISTLWQQLETSGFLDMLLPEEAGGAAMSLDEACAGFMAAGRHAMPVSFVQTVLARAWLHAVGASVPKGPIAIAGPQSRRNADGTLEAQAVAYGKSAEWVLAEFGHEWMLLPRAAARVADDDVQGGQDADFHWPALPDDAFIVAADQGGDACSPAELCAASLVPLLAGAASQALDMTLAYIAQRKQFGKPIAQFQAVQNQISVMAQRVWAMRMAARLVCHAPGAMPSARLVAIGKTRCSEAAATVADIAHALHGAIGITEEYDLQLYTRRLREWRRAGGGEAWWARRIGQEIIDHDADRALDYILACTREKGA